ncbi:MAG: tRNA-guanine transglycosylase DpdA [Candidatus Hodarchaeota archaeon]
MAFHLITTCVSQKKAKQTESILDPEIVPGSVEHVFTQWHNLLSRSRLPAVRAKDLYRGPLWNASREVWGIVNGRVKDTQFWIISAGYGLINAEDRVVPYDITFQEPRVGIPSIFAKITGLTGVNSRQKALQRWWELLIKSKSKEPASLHSLITRSPEDDYFLVVLGKDYLDATFLDLEKGIISAKTPEHIAVISNNVNDPLAKRLGPNWLYADSRFVNLSGSNNTVVNAKIAKAIVWHMFQEENGLPWWSLENFGEHLRQLSATLSSPERPVREPSTDSQVKAYIREVLSVDEVPFSRLHRAFRDSGRACEYSRFRNLYRDVKNELRKHASAVRPVLPVYYEPRKARMLFFLPDWDDRVDPQFDFEKDQVTPFRDPYEHDAYHYELYGTLNCDGILVSKSVLEANPQKKERAKNLGIHRYLRVPRNVPVLGDCGAFNYICEENPPYETDEILHYYQNLGFDFGVSIDHLIVPSILKRDRYLKKDGNDWLEIGETEFAKFKDSPNTLVIKKRASYRQGRLFPEENVLVEENYVDEREKQRRYEITIENARLFIEGHRKKRFSFTPIGAAQGWDGESYAYAVKEYQKMCYSRIALGGLVRTSTQEILTILEAINKIRKPDTQLHIFGVARLEAMRTFMKFGVSSVDSAGMLRQAWLSASDNYYSTDMNHYTAVRVPPAVKSPRGKKAIESGRIKQDELLDLEAKCLCSLKGFDQGKVPLKETHKVLMAYNEVLGGSDNLSDKYLRTLVEQPWKKCPCKLCRDTGIDIVIFRRNNRNRRRGFHNTWVFFNKFNELTRA